LFLPSKTSIEQFRNPQQSNIDSLETGAASEKKPGWREDKNISLMAHKRLPANVSSWDVCRRVRD
jgi:hypothetical protein